MSVGGEVVETIALSDRVWIDTLDRGIRCAIYVTRTDASRSVSPGDWVWWQGFHAYWTPKGRYFLDKQLARIGPSGISRAQCMARFTLERAT